MPLELVKKLILTYDSIRKLENGISFFHKFPIRGKSYKIKIFNYQNFVSEKIDIFFKF